MSTYKDYKKYNKPYFIRLKQKDERFEDKGRWNVEKNFFKTYGWEFEIKATDVGDAEDAVRRFLRDYHAISNFYELNIRFAGCNGSYPNHETLHFYEVKYPDGKLEIYEVAAKGEDHYSPHNYDPGLAFKIGLLFHPEIIASTLFVIFGGMILLALFI